MNVMDQNDSAVVGIFHNVIFDCLCIAVLPVFGVYRPIDQRSTHRRPDPGIGAAVGRTDQICRPLPTGQVQQGVGPLNLAPYPAIRQVSQIRVVIAVVGHLVSLPVDPGHSIRVIFYIGPHHEEGHLNAPGLQPVQQAAGMGAWPIVKRERHQLAPRGGLGWSDSQSGQQCQSEQQHQNSFHEQHLFLSQMLSCYHISRKTASRKNIKNY